MSQCSEDDWRKLLNTEIQREARFQGDMAVEVLSANDNSQQQIKDIEKFISDGKDLIIVAPNVAEDVRPVIEKAYDKGIPVILIDRRTSGNKYSAFIGADNHLIGEQIADFIRMKSKSKSVNIIELRGLKGSSPDVGRHEGFVKKNLHPLASVHANWNEDDAYNAMDSLLKIYPHIDYVYAHNDRMALGAYKAIKRAGREKEIGIIGVDALLLDGGGVDLVMQKKLIASFIYPTGGSEAIILAKQILQGEKYRKEIELPSALVDVNNARVMKLQYRTMCQQDEKYKKLETLTDNQLDKINRQEFLLGGFILLVFLCGIAILTLIKLNREKANMNDLMMSQIKSLVSQTTSALPVIPEVIEETVENKIEENKTEEYKTEEYKTDIKLLNRISEIINKHISDPDFSINDIADELCLSRVQLYRRIKAMSGANLTELIRNARLERARDILANATTTKSISEVAYEVGFSSPSYFTKCFKDYFGISPSAVDKI
ncbi:MAG: substrate-binding domain-containing protein [Bacteroidaceae bacterium]|nr:substrate-binding domain-containing protein [Bacteroidaceae bacterium]